MTFNELQKSAFKYFEDKVFCFSWEWYNKVKEAVNRGASKEEIDAIQDEVDYNSAKYNGCDIVNAYLSGYWLARKELGLPKCDKIKETEEDGKDN